jgi:nitroreductase
LGTEIGKSGSKSLQERPSVSGEDVVTARCWIAAEHDPPGKVAVGMVAQFPDVDTIHKVLSLALRAPSIHNSQPWRWQVGADNLQLFAEPSLQLPQVDPDGRDLMVSCGAALNHCALALAALGWQARIRRFPDLAEPSHLADIHVRPIAAGEVDIALAAAIPRRRTDRRVYSRWSVAHGDIALMAARAARAGIVLRRVDAPASLNSIVAQAVWQHATDQPYLTELATWSGRYRSVAGVPARSTPGSEPTAVLPGRIFAGTALSQPPDASAAEENAVVLALGTTDDDPLAQLRAGEATSLVSLTATALGLASCPVTEPLELAGTRAAVRAEIFDDKEFPQMLLRVGWAPINADPLPSTPRRPLADVVEWSTK